MRRHQRFLLTAILTLVAHSARAEPGFRVVFEPGIVGERKFDTDTEAVVPRLLKLPPDEALFTEFVWIPKSWLDPHAWTVAEMAEQDAPVGSAGAALRAALETARPQGDLVSRAATLMAVLRAGSPVSAPGGGAQRLRPLWECLADSPGNTALDAAFHTMTVAHGFSHEVGLARAQGVAGPLVVALVPGSGAGCVSTDDVAGRCALGAPSDSGRLHLEATWSLPDVTKPGWSPFATPLPGPPPSAAGSAPPEGRAWLARRAEVCEQAAALGLKCVPADVAEAKSPSTSKDDMYLLLTAGTAVALAGAAVKLVLDRRRRARLRAQRLAEDRSRRF